MLRHVYGGAVIFIFLQEFILPCLTDCPACKPDEGGIAIRAVSQAGQNEFQQKNKKLLLPPHISGVYSFVQLIANSARFGVSIGSFYFVELVRIEVKLDFK